VTDGRTDRIHVKTVTAHDTQYKADPELHANITTAGVGVKKTFFSL